jgi:hypothetical protein
MADNPNTVNKEALKNKLLNKLSKLGVEAPPVLTGGVSRRIKTYRKKQRRGTRRLLK